MLENRQDSKVGLPTAVALLVCLLAVYSASKAQPAMSGAEAVRMIDWLAVGAGAPIPYLMPAAASDDPLEAGFARQWLERAVVPANTVSAKLALDIVSERRTPDDHWAYAMEKELREIIRSKLQKSKNSRVFCNAVGCLCYVERDESFLRNPVVYRELLGERGHKFGLAQSDLDATVHPVRPGIPWELTFVKRPRGPEPTSAALPNPQPR
jgi:hypothetical protein